MMALLVLVARQDSNGVSKFGGGSRFKWRLQDSVAFGKYDGVSKVRWRGQDSMALVVLVAVQCSMAVQDWMAFASSVAVQ